MHFYPRPPRGGRHNYLDIMHEGRKNFYPRPPRGGRPPASVHTAQQAIISIHALREEGDPRRAWPAALIGVFLSTPSARRATRKKSRQCWRVKHFYPRPPRGGRLPCPRSARRSLSPDFYPRPPRGGRRHRAKNQHQHTQFLSTPSARRATKERGGGKGNRKISIHALREEGDGKLEAVSVDRDNFYPRPPRGGRPSAGRPSANPRPISIHALREEGDCSHSASGCIISIFLSTPSARRATPLRARRSPPPGQFLSTPSARRATASRTIRNRLYGRFLSTPSARRATLTAQGHSSGSCLDFYPRPPRGGRHACSYQRDYIKTISIHALREEGDGQGQVGAPLGNQFLSTPSARRATPALKDPVAASLYFYPRPPRGGRLRGHTTG